MSPDVERLRTDFAYFVETVLARKAPRLTAPQRVMLDAFEQYLRFCEDCRAEVVRRITWWPRARAERGRIVCPPAHHAADLLKP